MIFNKPIGGEPWFDISIFDNNLNNFEGSGCTFLSGGQSALNYIIKDIKIRNDEFILVPSYLCPTIIGNLERNQVNYRFYKINLDLSIDLEDLSNKVSAFNVKCVFFINYFGFYNDTTTIEFFNLLKKQNITIIEDAVQMLWFSKKNFVGDYVFNSFRKFLPIDGSLVLGKTIDNYESVHDKYYEYMNDARMKITAFVKFGLGTVEGFVDLYSKAEEEYGHGTEIDGMTDISKLLLNKVNGEYIGAIRRRNYAYLYDQLSGYSNIKILFNKSLLNENIPIGFPILIKDRDNIKIKLREKSIYCPAHWPILNEKWVNNYQESIQLASNILTLPIDQRYDINDLDRLVYEINNLLFP